MIKQEKDILIYDLDLQETLSFDSGELLSDKLFDRAQQFIELQDDLKKSARYAIDHLMTLDNSDWQVKF